VAEVFGAVGALEDVVVGPPSTEVRVLDGEFADEFGQGRVVRMASGVQLVFKPFLMV